MIAAENGVEDSSKITLKGIHIQFLIFAVGVFWTVYLFFIFFFRNVGGNIRDGITGFSGSVMSKPREFAHLIKNKFGSADNINQLSGMLLLFLKHFF